MTAEAQRRLILHMSGSLDGFVARNDGAVDWLGTGEQHGATRHHANLEMIGQVGLIVTGRGAYQDMVHAWPSSDSPMGRLINRLLKVVSSDGVNTVEWENARPNEASGARAGWPWPAGRAMSISLSRSTASVEGLRDELPVTEGPSRWES